MARPTRQEAVNRSLRTNQGKSVRSEDLKRYDEFFVDPIDSSVFRENTKQVVYGRRGSGKTLLFGTVNQAIQADFPQVRIMSFAYSATEFRSSADVADTATVKETANAYFRFFIDKLCADIEALADRALAKPELLESLTRGGEETASRRDKLELAVLELWELATYGVEAPRPSDLTSEWEGRDVSTTRRGRFGSAAAGLDLKSGPRLAFGASIGRGTGTEHQATIHNVLRTERRFSPSHVKRKLVEVIELLGLEHLVVFIDEWMSLGSCQVEFAQRLNECLFHEERIGVKIAADRFQGRFNNSGQGTNFRGLDVGGDIFVAADLDYPFRDRERGFQLLSEALYRRLSFFERSLEDHFGKPPAWNADRFLNTLFETPQAFTELCVGAQGLVRDFHEIFKGCAKEIDWDVSSRQIDVESVRRATMAQNAATYDRVIRSVSANTLVFKVITPHILSARSRYFLLESRPGAYTRVVHDLLSRRLIHDVPSEAIHPSIRGEYDVFEISQGIFLELMRASEFATGEEVDITYDSAELQTITRANLAKFLLDLSLLDDALHETATTLLCPYCNEEFFSSDRAFVARHICPHCFQDQP
jgi:hypothetical protein